MRIPLRFGCPAAAFVILACSAKIIVQNDSPSSGGSASTGGTFSAGGFKASGGDVQTGGAPIAGNTSAVGGSSSIGATSGIGGGSPATCTDAVTDAAAKAFACAPNWGCSHPLCGITMDGNAIAKGIACIPADQQLCYKTCGPMNVGFKSETCSGGVYAEQSDCSFDPVCDFSCFKLPDSADPTCPTTPPTHGTACSLAPCVVCGGTTSGQTTGYLDSLRSAKIGFCVCVPATATTTQKWSCATAGTIWPCPGNAGC